MGTCSHCGRDNAADARFCSGCGSPLASSADGEVRKTVTIVFCDLVGSTALGERSDPELLRSVMRRYHAELRRVLEQHGGTVEKFVGDAAMAVFGIPQAHEDDALRAARAAVAMREATDRLGLEVRIGVNTGEVVTGTGETLVTGDAVNVAARLEQHAATGEVLIGAATAALVRDHLEIEPVPPLTVKGKSAPVPAYRVVGLVVPAAAAAPTRVVGRQHELDHLHRLVDVATDKRIPQLVTIVGLPGVGKSTLVASLLSSRDADVMVGHCLSYGEGITYWPIAEIVRALGDLTPLFDNVPDGAEIALRLRAADGQAGAVATPEEIAWGFRRLLETRESSGRPLIVLIEDIHWAEPTLLDLIEYTLAFTRDTPLLIVCTARPELFERRPDWSAPRQNAQTLALEPLAVEHADQLVADLADVDADVRRRIVDAAEGNPLFVEQLVAAYNESADGRLEVPPSLHALLTARIDALQPAERAVVDRGSVEGRVFHRTAVTELLPESDRRDVAARLLSLVRRELVQPDEARLPGDDAFRFGHLLIRDAAYDAMPKRLRAELHERFARWLTGRLGAQAPAEIVGYHFEQAYHYRVELGGDTGDLAAESARHLLAASGGARLRGDAAAAVNLLRRVVDVLPSDDAVRRESLLSLARELREAGEQERATAALAEVEAAATSTGDRRLALLARIEKEQTRLTQDSSGVAEDTEALVAEAVASSDDDEVLAHAWALAAAAYSYRGQLATWLQALERGRHHARAAGDRALEIEMITQSAGPYVLGPIPVDAGLRHVEEVLRDAGDVPAIRAMARHLEAHLHARQGDFLDAFDAIHAWRQHFRELGREVMYAGTAICVRDIGMLAEEYDVVVAAAREAMDIFERTGNLAYRSTTAADLGLAQFHLGNVDEAMALSRLSEELGAPDDVMNEAAWRSLRAQVLAAQGDTMAALPFARQAVEVADRTDMLDMAAECHLALASVLAQAGNAECRDEAMTALRLYREKGNVVGAARAERVLG